MQEIESLKKQLKAEFKVKDLGTMRYFLRMEVARSKEGIFVSQRKYTLDLLKEAGMLRCRLAGIPLEMNWKSGEINDDAPVEKERYQWLVGKLIHLSLTRLDIAYAMSVTS